MVVSFDQCLGLWSELSTGAPPSQREGGEQAAPPRLVEQVACTRGGLAKLPGGILYRPRAAVVERGYVGEASVQQNLVA